MSAPPRYRRTSCALGAALLALGLTACPPPGRSSEGSAQKPSVSCKKEGDNCEYAPGKIGLCTAKIGDCADAPCLTCASLH